MERVECVRIPNSILSVKRCVAKSLSRDRIHVDGLGVVSRTINTTFIHVSVYYQFSNNEYRPFLINKWEDLCGYFRGEMGNFLIAFIYPVIRDYTNIGHTCPIKADSYYFKIKNESINMFNYDQLVPAGRYRIDIDAHEGFEGKQFLKIKIYGSVSDHRIERF